MLLIVTTDDALLEGLAQVLASTGVGVVAARSIDDAVEATRRNSPLLAIVDRGLLAGRGAEDLGRLPLAPGGALVTFRTTAAPVDPVALAPGIARMLLAEVELPLERARLVALVEHVATRARRAGRAPRVTPPESPAS
jgi:DNA-binding NtrC family response regulator